LEGILENLPKIVGVEKLSCGRTIAPAATTAVMVAMSGCCYSIARWHQAAQFVACYSI